MVAIRTPYRLEGKENVLKLMVSPRFKKEAQALLKFLKKTIPLQRIKDEEALKIAET
jgi:hypothetical protein